MLLTVLSGVIYAVVLGAQQFIACPCGGKPVTADAWPSVNTLRNDRENWQQHYSGLVIECNRPPFGIAIPAGLAYNGIDVDRH